MIEQVILGIFLVLPLVIVAALFSDELWQEHRRQHPRDENAPHIDWKHPWRRVRRGHWRRSSPSANPRRPEHRGPRSMPGTPLALRSDSRPIRETPT